MFIAMHFTILTEICYKEVTDMLEKEGHIIIQKGRTNIKYYVKDYEQSLFAL